MSLFSRRFAIPLAAMLLAGCGSTERVETKIELTILNLDPSVDELGFVFSVSQGRSEYRSEEKRRVTTAATRTIVFDRMIVNPTIDLSIDADAMGETIQHGILFGETTEARVAKWTVTLAPANAPKSVCDGLDNNENGAVDEAGCSG